MNFCAFLALFFTWVVAESNGDCGTFGYEYIDSVRLNSNDGSDMTWTEASSICFDLIEGGIIANIDSSNQVNELNYAISFANKYHKNIFINNDNVCGYVSHTDGLWHSLILSNSDECDDTFKLSGVLCSSWIDPCIAYGEDTSEDYNDGIIMTHYYQILDLENGNKIYPSIVFQNTARSEGFLFAPNDERRVWTDASFTGITYAIDGTDPPIGTEITNETLNNWISETERGFYDWFDAGCMNSYQLDGYVSDVGIGRPEVGVRPPLTGVYEQVADVTFEGFMTLRNDNILGVANFWYFRNDYDSQITRAAGPFTDINNDNLADLAFCHIRLTNNLPFSTDESTRFDVYTVMAHEFGHCLGINHYGLIKAFRDENDTVIRYVQAPPAIMQPYYDTKDENLLGSDIGALCSLWSNWA